MFLKKISLLIALFGINILGVTQVQASPKHQHSNPIIIQHGTSSTPYNSSEEIIRQQFSRIYEHGSSSISPLSDYGCDDSLIKWGEIYPDPHQVTLQRVYGPQYLVVPKLDCNKDSRYNSFNFFSAYPSSLYPIQELGNYYIFLIPSIRFER